MLMISPRMASGMQEKQYSPSLLSFFIYNPKFGPREGEEEKKILFYHPCDVEKNEKIRNVGLCEAIVQFTRTFCPTKPAKSLHTQKNRQFFHEPEENFWMVMVVRNPMVEKPNKDGKPPTIEYQEEEILEEKKILFYHPCDVEKNEKIRNVGLCEAIVQFTRTFCPTKPAKSLHTQKNRQFFHEPEENFWMVMVVRNPMVEKPNKDGKPPTIEYQEEEILDSVYGAVLQQCYSMYKLFNGTFIRAFEAGGVELLTQKLEKFFYRYIQTLHLQSCDLLDVFGGISFFPLDKMTYLKIQSFVNRVEESLSLVKYTAFLYNDQLIW
ncbi:hypothetical protein PGIGA_G00036020 [Pangasianodon gigas]|uniref:Uncharacterized protein n=1 Tax=Pangasianodon gigas TaxID=30993 RepID=A0ACC5WYV5_PANGG|nr:hypothetical protein [Pangasianodon gigas]